MLEVVNKQNFNELLGRFSASELETLIEKFPYFQHAHLLLAKKYQQQNNPRFDQQLQLAALYTQDRELFYAIFNEKEIKASLPDFPAIEKEPQLLETPESSIELQKNTEENISEPVENESLLNWQVGQLPIEPVTEVNPVIAVHETISSNDPIIYQEPEPIAEVANAVAPLVEQPMVEEESGIHETDLVEEDADVLETATEPVEEVKVNEEPPVAETESFSVSDPHTFDEWLKAYTKVKEAPVITKLNQQPPVEPEKQDEELEKLYLANIPVNLQELVEEETNYSKGLDKFIARQIQKHKGITVKATASENEIDPELVTETMAKVYEMQKKYQKAIKCYETLGLKYPEKFDFFAARINYLKNIT